MRNTWREKSRETPGGEAFFFKLQGVSLEKFIIANGNFSKDCPVSKVGF